MFSPMVIMGFYDKLGNAFWILLILSICYDAYMYSCILKLEYIESLEKRYKDYIKPNKIVNIEISDSEHVKIYEKFVEEIIDRLKKY